MYEKWQKIGFLANIPSFLPPNLSFTGYDGHSLSEPSFSHPPGQFLDFHYFHRGLTGAAFGANLTKNGAFYLHTDIYEPRNQIQTIRTQFGSWSGQSTHLHIKFWNLTLLTEDPLHLFWGQNEEWCILSLYWHIWASKPNLNNKNKLLIQIFRLMDCTEWLRPYHYPVVKLEPYIWPGIIAVQKENSDRLQSRARATTTVASFWHILTPSLIKQLLKQLILHWVLGREH